MNPDFPVTAIVPIEAYDPLTHSAGLVAVPALLRRRDGRELLLPRDV